MGLKATAIHDVGKYAAPSLFQLLYHYSPGDSKVTRRVERSEYRAKVARRTTGALYGVRPRIAEFCRVFVVRAGRCSYFGVAGVGTGGNGRSYRLGGCGMKIPVSVPKRFHIGRFLAFGASMLPRANLAG